MKVLISQSNYIPWRGFLDLVQSADVYVIYDSMQFTKNDWRNRNLIRSHDKEIWLSIPCGPSISRSIDEVYPTKAGWNIKHWKTIHHSYSKSPYWSSFSSLLKNAYYSIGNASLSKINKEFLMLALTFLDSKTLVLHDCDLFERKKLLSMDRSERLLRICKELNASTYLSAPAGKNYLDVECFLKENIDVSFFSYPRYPSYSNSGQVFQPSRELSWVDVLMYRGELF
ncbi:WbqC family protein [Prochlorococcus marinus]|uniref:WbqC family protein n=1 Tax=Prochlorococcus marinus TaxID=1219 RepID=UPI0007B3520E|nr:WbqC family protein [Prochlorococcus marinus]KZR73692.1 WbqC-like protein family protein [Prochlorococcus marinus str. MIT 1320]